jgi:Zn-dependent protease/CBS domain-containing protein
MFGARWRIFRLLGIPIYIDVSWLIILVLITFLLTTNFKQEVDGLTTYEYVGMGLVTALAYFACILLHELGHATVARATGLPIRGITLFIFGGVAELSEEPKSAGGEFVMAVAGPAVSAVLGALFLALYALGASFGWPAPVLAVFHWLGVINLVLLAFNMIPGFPLDGGRVLRSVLWGVTGNLRRSTWWASLGGRAFAWVLIGWGLLTILSPFFNPGADGGRGLDLSGLWLVIIGWFVNNAAKGSYQQVLVRQALGGEPVRRFMNTQPIVVPPWTDLRHFVEDYVYRHHRKAFPVGAEGRVEGYVSTRMLGQYSRDEWAGHTVADVMERDWKALSIAPTDDALKALGMMQRTGLSRLLVVEGETLVGIVSLKDLLRFLHLKLELEGGEGDGNPSQPPLRDSRRESERPSHHP